MPAPPWQLTGNGIILVYRFTREWALAHGGIPEHRKTAFTGGFGMVMAVDYRESPVGPYTELLFIPGQFRVGDREHWSITRIVVNSQASVDAGRANWGIPKTLGDLSVDVEAGLVRLVDNGRPAATLEVRAVGPRLPFDTAWSPLRFSLVQDGPAGALVTRPAGSGMLRMARLRRWHADPAVFPDLSRFRPWAAVVASNFALTFPAPEALPA